MAETDSNTNSGENSPTGNNQSKITCGSDSKINTISFLSEINKLHHIHKD
jgi:hypothetical protein